MRPEDVFRACVFSRICGRMDDTVVEVEMEGGQCEVISGRKDNLNVCPISGRGGSTSLETDCLMDQKSLLGQLFKNKVLTN